MNNKNIKQRNTTTDKKVRAVDREVAERLGESYDPRVMDRLSEHISAQLPRDQEPPHMYTYIYIYI